MLNPFTNSYAQPQNIAGIYYLAGVMETASGIKLNPDSTFQFFFSQGALDRTGEGKWSLSNDEITLQSDTLKSQGFKLIESKNTNQKGSRIEIVTDNEMILSYIHISIEGTQQSDFVELDESGKALFNNKIKDNVNIFFELCPEKIYCIQPSHKNDNVLKIELLPEIFNVSFNQIKLKIQNENLIGQHPLLSGSNYKFEKNN